MGEGPGCAKCVGDGHPGHHAATAEIVQGRLGQLFLAAKEMGTARDVEQ